jgi:transposase-like protein
VFDEGKTVGAVARELDLTPSSLAKWVSQRAPIEALARRG